MHQGHWVCGEISQKIMERWCRPGWRDASRQRSLFLTGMSLPGEGHLRVHGSKDRIVSIHQMLGPHHNNIGVYLFWKDACFDQSLFPSPPDGAMASHRC